MKKLNFNEFIFSLKKSYDSIPYIKGDNAAKKMVVDSIKSNGFTPKDVLSSIGKTLKLTSTVDKNFVNKVIRIGGSVGENLKIYQEQLKGKLSLEEMVSLACKCSNKDLDCLKNEISIDCYGWKNAVETIIKSKSGKTEVKKTEIKKEESVKPEVKKSHRRSITLINAETGEIKTWKSYSDCDKELGKKRGHTSQLVSGKCKTINGVWTLYKKTPVKTPKTVVEKTEGSRMRPILQIKIDTKGKEKVVRRFKSITEAAKMTGIKHSSICKNAKGLYQSAGGFVWKYEEISA